MCFSHISNGVCVMQLVTRKITVYYCITLLGVPMVTRNNDPQMKLSLSLPLITLMLSLRK